MKDYIFIFIFLFAFSLSGESQNIRKSGFNINIKFFSAEEPEKNITANCEALFIKNNDTIVSQPDSIYNIQFPCKNTKLVVRYKEFYQEVNSDKYLNHVLRPGETVFIKIILNPKNKNGGYFITYGLAEFGHVEKFGRSRRGRHFHNIKFSLYPNF